MLHLWREDKDVIIITAGTDDCGNSKSCERLVSSYALSAFANFVTRRKLSVKRSEVVVYSMMVTCHTLVPVEHIVIISVITINRAAVRCSNAERAS